MEENEKWDGIVIGGGLTGLTAAAYLAKAGERVVLFEQQQVTGGCCAGCVQSGTTAPPSVHYINDAQVVNDVLSELDAGTVRFQAPDPVFRVAGPCPSTELLVSADRGVFIGSARKMLPQVSDEVVTNAMNRLIDLATEVYREGRQLPLESPELMSFFKRLALGFSVQKKLPKSMEYGRMPIERFLATLFPGEEMHCLRGALRSLAPVRGARAFDLLKVIGNISTGNMMLPVGGIPAITRALEGAFRAYGGEIRTGAKVTAINVTKGFVDGVTLADGVIIPGYLVISTVDMKETFFSLLPENVPPRLLREKLSKIPLSDPVITINLNTSLSREQLPPDRNIRIIVNPDVSEHEIFKGDDPEAVSFSIAFPEPETSPGLVQLVALVRFGYEDNWHSGPKYDLETEHREFARSYAMTLVERAEAELPGLLSHIISTEITTPVDYQICTGNDMGAPFGWKRPQMWRQKVPYVQGLYMAGHWTFPGPGVHAAIMSGKNVARIILSGG